MQKKLLTLAVAGALAVPGVASAQSSVEVYGTISMSLNKMKYSESQSGAPSVSKWDVASHGSNVGVRGRETLGGGLSAWFQVETNAAMERSNNQANVSGFASRNSAVGLQGGFGNVFLGQWTTPWADLDALWGIGSVGGWTVPLSIISRRETTGVVNWQCAANAPGAGGISSCESLIASKGVGHPFWRRTSNSIFYQSPVFSGMQVKLSYQTDQDKSTAGPVVAQQDPSMISSSLQWAGMGGRARIGVAYDRHKDFTSIGKTDNGYAVKGGWNFGVVDVGLAYERMTYKAPSTDCKATQYAIGVAVPVGMGAIRASYAVAKDIEGDYTGAVDVTGSTGSCGATPTAAAPSNDNGAKEWTLGYEHRFSKRTTVSVGYAAITNDPGAVFTWSGASSNQTGVSVTPLAGSDVSAAFVHMIHRF